MNTGFWITEWNNAQCWGCSALVRELGDSAGYINLRRHRGGVGWGGGVGGGGVCRRGWSQTEALTSATIICLKENTNGKNKIPLRTHKICMYSDTHVWTVVNENTYKHTTHLHVYALWQLPLADVTPVLIQVSAASMLNVFFLWLMFHHSYDVKKSEFALFLCQKLVSLCHAALI